MVYFQKSADEEGAISYGEDDFTREALYEWVRDIDELDSQWLEMGVPMYHKDEENKPKRNIEEELKSRNYKVYADEQSEEMSHGNYDQDL